MLLLVHLLPRRSRTQWAISIEAFLVEWIHELVNQWDDNARNKRTRQEKVVEIMFRLVHVGVFAVIIEVNGPSPIRMRSTEAVRILTSISRNLGDAVSIQSAMSEVCELMLHRRIEPKEASALFYAMQVASTNLAVLNANKNQGPVSEKNSKNGSPAPASSKPDPLPPGTIHACKQPRRHKRRLRA